MELSEKEWNAIVARLDEPEIEHTEFDRWLTRSEENQAIFRKIETLWNQSAHLPYLDKLKLAEDWNNIQSKIQPEKKPIRSWVAAVVSLLIVSGFLLYNNLTTETSWQTYTATNKILEIQLLDGSSITLNKESSLKVSESFQEERNLMLQGEAFFQVASDPNNPFKVLTGRTTTEVLGTAFQIKSMENGVLLQVTEGSVSFSTDQNEEIVTAGKAVEWITDEGIHSLDYETNQMSWKTGFLQFDKTPLDQVAKDLIRHFQIEIALEGFDSYPSVTTKFQDPILVEVLDELALILSLEVSVVNNSYVIKPLRP